MSARHLLSLPTPRSIAGPTGGATPEVSTTQVRYQSSDAGWWDIEPLIRRLIDERGLRTICEVGGGANPLLPLDYVVQRGLAYSVLDVSREELEKAPAGYEKLLIDAAAPHLAIRDQFDLIFSRLVLEHVRDGRRLHQNVYQMLRPGGIAVHYFPTLYALPFLVNKVTPEGIVRLLLRLVAPRDPVRRVKFPAYYSWCRGPTASMRRRLDALGYEVVEYRGFFGHPAYYQRVPLIRTIHARWSALLLRHPVPYLTSYALTVLRKRNRARTADRSSAR